jgi:hypothetical protein
MCLENCIAAHIKHGGNPCNEIVQAQPTRNRRRSACIAVGRDGRDYNDVLPIEP